jgi:hypothetical protein
MRSKERYGGSSSLNPDSGATAVEFALVLLLVFGLLGAIFTAGIAYFHYTILVHTTTISTRKTAVDVQSGVNCAQLVAAAPGRAQGYLSSLFGFNGAPVSFQATVKHTPSGQCTLHLHGTWPVECVLCNLFGQGIALHAEGDSLIEDECFSCDC